MSIDPVERDREDNANMRRLFAFALAHDANCIDVGAHAGAILREILRCAPHGRHIAYEPLPSFYERLVTEFPQVDVRFAALSNEAGTTTFKHVRTNPVTAASVSGRIQVRRRFRRSRSVRNVLTPSCRRDICQRS